MVPEKPDHHPENDLYEDGEKAFLTGGAAVAAALEGRTLTEACDHLGHRKDTDSARQARRLLKLLPPRDAETIKSAVLRAIQNGEPFPVKCTLRDKQLAGLSGVYAHVEGNEIWIRSQPPG